MVDPPCGVTEKPFAHGLLSRNGRGGSSGCGAEKAVAGRRRRRHPCGRSGLPKIGLQPNVQDYLRGRRHPTDPPQEEWQRIDRVLAVPPLRASPAVPHQPRPGAAGGTRTHRAKGRSARRHPGRQAGDAGRTGPGHEGLRAAAERHGPADGRHARARSSIIPPQSIAAGGGISIGEQRI